jgi:tetratricopeptide (TPR) repeat protein
MNMNLANAVKRIVSEKGGAILDNSRQVQSLFSQNSAKEPGPEKRALLTFLAKGYHKILKQSPDNGRLNCKIALATKLRDEDGIDIHLCKNTIDVMEWVFFGRVTIRTQSVAPQPVPHIPINHPAKAKAPRARYIAIAAAVLVVIFAGILLLALPEETAEGLFQRGNTAFNNGDYRKAIEYYGRAINLDREYYEAYLQRGHAYINAGNYDAAVNDLNYYTAINTENFTTFALLGYAYAGQEKYDNALKAFSNAIAIDPETIATYNARGAIYLMSKKYDAAIRDFEKALGLDPADYDAITYLAAAKEAKEAETQALANELLSAFFSGDPYTALYNFGFKLGLKELLGE